MASLLSIISNRLPIITSTCSQLRRVSIFGVNCIFLTERDMSVRQFGVFFFVHLTKWGIRINEFGVATRRADSADTVGGFAGLKHNDCLHLFSEDKKQCSNWSKMLVSAHPRHSYFIFHAVVRRINMAFPWLLLIPEVV